MFVVAVIGWGFAAVFFLSWRKALERARGWRTLFEAHFVDPTLKGH